MIRNLVFDMGQVLMYFEPGVYIDRLGVPEEDRAALWREVFRSVEWIRLDRGDLSMEDAAESMCRRLPSRLHGCVHSLVFDWWRGPLHPVPGMEELLSELKALGYGLYLLSNAGVNLPRFFPRIPGSQYFDGRVVSADWRQLKPEREIYATLFREFRLRPEECLFIDDLNINIEGAHFAGMPGILFRDDVPRLRRELRAAGVLVKGEDAGDSY